MGEISSRSGILLALPEAEKRPERRRRAEEAEEPTAEKEVSEPVG